MTSIWIRLIAVSMAIISVLPASAFRVAKTDFPHFVGIIGCEDSGDSCTGAEQGYVLHGLAGDADFMDPSSPSLTKGNRTVMGFLEGKPFAWNRYSLDFPNAKSKWIVLNELTVGEGNRAFLTLWKGVGDSLEFIKVEPRYFSLTMGEAFLQGKTTLPDGSILLLVKGEGADAGINIQDFRIVRLQVANNTMTQVDQHINRSEIPLQKILNQLNADEVVEPVLDSTLGCDLPSGRKAPSGGPWVRCIKSRNRVLYTKAGPEETPLGKDTIQVDIWKIIRDKSKAGR